MRSRDNSVSITEYHLAPEHLEGSKIMAPTDKAKNKGQESKGRLKKAIGRTTGNDDLRAEGRADQARGALKQAGEKVKDAFGK